MMIRYVLAFVLLWQAHGSAQELSEAWKVNLQEQYQYQNFDRDIVRNWVSQQGVVFLTPQEIAVYQVSKRRSSAGLAGRDTSGGAGNFFLDIKILDAQAGRLIKALHLPTSATFSKVAPTHDGKFIVRTGEMLYLYSSDFQQVASRDLPLKRRAPLEEWEVNVDHSGQHIVLAHQKLFLREQSSGEGDMDSGKSSAAVEVLDADTLRTAKNFDVSNYMTHWSVGDNFLVGTHPTAPSRFGEFGRMDFTGQWTSLNSLWKVPRNACTYLMDALEHQFVAVYGCNRLFVLSPEGQKIFSAKAGPDEYFASVANADSYLAAESDHPEVRFGKSITKPLRVELYDLNRKTILKWVNVEGATVYYDVSRKGDLAVVDGYELTLYSKDR